MIISMKFFLRPIIYSLLLLGCSAPSVVTDSVTTIPVNRDHRQLEMASFISRVDSMKLMVSQEHQSAPVQDFSIGDSLLYLLDKAKSISVFSLRNGQMKKYVHTVGHGHNEYIAPQAIHYCNGYVYVLDFQGKCVLKYDKDMTFISRIATALPALDFAVLPDGFLFFNMSATEKRKRVVRTDFDGNDVDSFLDSDGTLGLVYNDKMFTEDPHGNIYYTDPISQSVYLWDGNKLELAFNFDFPSDKNKKPSLCTNIVTKEGVITQYLSDRIIKSNIYSSKTQMVESGPVATRSAYPFLPQATFDKGVIGVYPLNNANGYVLLKYYIKWQ